MVPCYIRNQKKNWRPDDQWAFDDTQLKRVWLSIPIKMLPKYNSFKIGFSRFMSPKEVYWLIQCSNGAGKTFIVQLVDQRSSCRCKQIWWSLVPAVDYLRFSEPPVLNPSCSMNTFRHIPVRYLSLFLGFMVAFYTVLMLTRKYMCNKYMVWHYLRECLFRKFTINV